MEYEALLVEADNEGLTVKEMPMRYNNGRIKGNRIAIRKDIDTSAEKTCVLAEELGHHYTTVGDITDLTSMNNQKQELKARLTAYDDRVRDRVSGTVYPGNLSFILRFHDCNGCGIHRDR